MTAGMTLAPTPYRALEAWGHFARASDTTAHGGASPSVVVKPVDTGLINDTFVVSCDSKKFLLQRVHGVFSPEIHHNIRAVSEHLRARGLESPQLIPTNSGQDYWTDASQRIWRMMEFVDGVTRTQLESTHQAQSAGSSLARWHAALADFRHRFVGLRLDVHNTEKHLTTLREALKAHRSHRLHADVAKLGDQILSDVQSLPALPQLSLAVAHGDPKISNLRFSPTGDGAIAWIDLDTVGPMRLAHELGDALRSWCNPGSEDDADAEVELELHRGAVSGYISERADLLRNHSEALQAALLWGPVWISLELSARFAADALTEHYFRYDARRFASLGTHNLARARGQFSLYSSFVRTHQTRETQIRGAVEQVGRASRT